MQSLPPPAARALCESRGVRLYSDASVCPLGGGDERKGGAVFDACSAKKASFAGAVDVLHLLLMSDTLITNQSHLSEMSPARRNGLDNGRAGPLFM